MTIVYHENRVWVRISATCNSKCIMCLDWDQIKLNKLIPEEVVKKQITQWFKPWMKNKIIISGWEASINPKFFDYIKYAKEIGYNKIQTVTNGLRCKLNKTLIKDPFKLSYLINQLTKNIYLTLGFRKLYHFIIIKILRSIKTINTKLTKIKFVIKSLKIAKINPCSIATLA